MRYENVKDSLSSERGHTVEVKVYDRGIYFVIPNPENADAVKACDDAYNQGMFIARQTKFCANEAFANPANWHEDWNPSNQSIEHIRID